MKSEDKDASVAPRIMGSRYLSASIVANQVIWRQTVLREREIRIKQMWQRNMTWVKKFP